MKETDSTVKKQTGIQPAATTEIITFDVLRKLTRLTLGPDDLKYLGVSGLNCGCYTNMMESALNTDWIGIGGRTYEMYKTYTVEDAFYLIDEKWLYLNHDARKNFPLEDGVFRWAVAEHFIEHLEQEEALHWLNEVYRLLAPDAVLRVSTPDLGKYVRAYEKRDLAFFQGISESLHQQGVEHCSSPASLFNLCFRGWKHKYIYDSTDLFALIRKSAFSDSNIEIVDHQQSSRPYLMNLDTDYRKIESIYVEITKK